MLASELRDAFLDEKLETVGAILHRGWLYKKELASNISNSDIDDLYNTALKYNATGGKLLGAGGTGFFLIYSKDHKQLQKHLGCRVLPFRIDREGTKIIFYE